MAQPNPTQKKRRGAPGGQASGIARSARATEREEHYLQLRAQGLSAAAIAERCGCTVWAAQAVLDRGRRRRRGA